MESLGISPRDPLVGFSRSDSEGFVYSKMILNVFSKVSFYMESLGISPGTPWLDSAGPIVKVSCIQNLILTLFSKVSFYHGIARN